jgi:dTDP-glucose pyrophosphorylase
MHAVIIAGGLGTRAQAMTGDRIPKALLPVGGVPIVFRQMRVLRREGVAQLTVLAGHLGAQLAGPLSEEARNLGLALDIRVEAEPLGTAGCLSVLTPADGDALLVYGDMLFDVALAPLADFHRARQALITIVAHPNDHPRTSDIIRERDGRVTALLPREIRRTRDERNLVPAGLYLASAGFLARIPPGQKLDMVRDVLPRLVAAGEPIAAYNTPEYMRDVGTATRHATAERDLADGTVAALNLGHKRPAIFFDVDGVLNEEPGLQGVLKPEDVALIPGAGAAVAEARNHQPPAGRARRHHVRRSRRHPRPAGSAARRAARHARPHLCLPAPSRQRVRGRGQGAENPLRVPQAGRTAVSPRHGRAADRACRLDRDRRQPARHRCGARRECLGVRGAHRARLPRRGALSGRRRRGAGSRSHVRGCGRGCALCPRLSRIGGAAR